ncbi:MAG: ribonuclease HI [Oscillospiraceae bacterium]
MKQITIYTDGACSGNPGPGGWGAVLDYKGTRREISGGDADTTNNRMEMMAFISALQLVKEPCEITLCSDSKYVIDGLSKGWAKGWRARGWVKSDRKPALNSDLWAMLLDLTESHKITYNWIKGHAGHKENERCDALAVAQSQKFR